MSYRVSPFSTSNIAIYYDNHLVGSMTLGEFMRQPRYGGHTALSLLGLPKQELISFYLTTDPVAAQHHPKCSGMTKGDLIWNILLHFWVEQGEVAWEKAAIKEFKRVYLSSAA